MLATGSTLGPYRILAPLGAGGMGEVYRARDTRLARDVALKVIHAEVARDPERIQRFQQEARAAGALSHPNVCSTYDLGMHEGSPFVVMELLEGESLRAKLEAGPVPIRKAVDWLAQAARGLAAAQEKGIVHRDLKPENLFVTKDGRVKVLDFGLAKLTRPEVLAPAGEQPISIAASETGAILGTVGYMAPEQVRGQPPDTRSDLFALGSILYELLTGKRAFHGASYVETLNAILNEEPPPLAATARDVPKVLELIVQRCLEKHPAERFQSASDFAFALETLSAGAGAGPASSGVGGVATRFLRGRERLPWVLAAAALLAALVLGWMSLLRRAPGPVLARFSIGPGPGACNIRWPRFSPDGRLVAYQADDSGRVTRIWIRPVGAFAAMPLAGTEGAGRPFWSPDSRSLAYVSGTQLERIAVGGGPPQLVGELEHGADGSWGEGGVILFDGSASDSIRWIRVDGGDQGPATRIDRAKGEFDTQWPMFLPDGKRFLFLAGRTGGRASMLKLGRLGSLESREIGPVPSRVEYSPSGYLLYVQDGTMMAQPFDASAARFTGDPFPVATDALVTGDMAHISVSYTGAIAYAVAEGSGRNVLAWVDRSGRTLSQLTEPGGYGDPVLSPDGTRVAYELADVGGRASGIWVRDLRRGVSTPVTSDRGAWAVWSPDGTHLARFIHEVQA